MTRRRRKYRYRETPEQRRARVRRERAEMTARCVAASRDEERWMNWHRNDLSTFKMPYDYPRQWPNRRMRKFDRISRMMRRRFMPVVRDVAREIAAHKSALMRGLVQP